MKLEDMNHEELAHYVTENSEKFLVLGVRSELISLIHGENFEKCFVKAVKTLFKNDSVTGLQTAALGFYGAGFDLEIHPANGVAITRGEVLTYIPYNAWMAYFSQVVAPLFEGQLTFVMKNTETGEKLEIVSNQENLRTFRTQFGVDLDSPIESELLRIFEIK